MNVLLFGTRTVKDEGWLGPMSLTAVTETLMMSQEMV